jgi:tartrate dehydrogenase/decarboxylase/D-malate dehydrogenase
MFEPVHGSAPDIAGQGICNPIGAIGSAALMLEHFGLFDEAKAVQRAIEETTGNGLRTRDVGGTASTAEVTAAIIENLANQPRARSRDALDASRLGGIALSRRSQPHVDLG